MKSKLKKIMEEEMENICRWLFGESKWQQKKKLKKLLILTAILAVIAILLLFDFEGPWGTVVMAVIILLMWGWSFVSATAATVGRIIAFFDSDMAMFVISLILWLFLGIIGGVISLVLGITRFIQIRNE